MQEKTITSRNRVTIKTVAKDAGVSVSAVSKVLRNAYGVSDALKTRVETSIERLGYRPSTAARGMRGQTYTIGVLLIGLENPFLPLVVNGIKSVLGNSNYRPMLSVSEARFPLETTLIDSMIDFRMDGLVLVAPRLSDELLNDYASRIPIVVIGHHEPEATAFDTVNSDDYAGGKLAAQSFIAAGHEKIHMLSLARNVTAHYEVFDRREQGYLDAMHSAGLKEHTKIVPVAPRIPDLIAHFGNWLAGGVAPSAIFCWSDMHAVPFIEAARMAGLNIPGELAIIGYDNSPVAALPSVGLSSVDQHGVQLGRLAAETLLSRIEGRSTAQHHLIAPDLARRASF